MVNIENMQKWIDALRSGEYTKIKGHLETPDGNCAEGVACREAIKDGVKLRVTSHVFGVTAFNDENTSAPQVVLEWLGLDEHPIGSGYWLGDMEIRRPTVVHLNDHTDQTFTDIADGLYRQYLKEPE